MDVLVRPLLALAFGLLASCAAFRPDENVRPPTSSRCAPSKAWCWPTEEQWRRFGASLSGKLEQPRSPLEACRVDAAGAACAGAMGRLKNPYAIEDDPGATESMGWLDAWDAQPSAYAVEAANAQDIAAAVDFARQHTLRLVVKGTGHDYLGRSNAPDSLLVWTHRMRQVTTRDAFTPAGCSNAAARPAVTVEAGARWLEVYREARSHGRYVQGGGCTSVGAAGGFLQGGGFGSWSRKYGIAAASMLEAEVVTADGKLRVANACQNQDLFWALRGGGGGTFGVVTKVTLAAYPAPTTLGFVIGSIKATSDPAFKELLERFVPFYREKLDNETWGEHVTVKENNTLELTMSFVDLTAAQAEDAWSPFLRWVEADPGRFAAEAHFVAIPGTKMWDDEYLRKVAPGTLTSDAASDPGAFWWSSNQGEVATYWYTYQSRWLPADLFDGPAARSLAGTLFEASRRWSLEVYFSKGQAGASPEAIARDSETSMNPAVLKAAALVIAAATSTGYPGVKGHEPDRTAGTEERARVTAAMAILRAATPGAGTYVNETDYFEPSWQREFWGDNYRRLLAIKRQVDPGGLFTCHHCVGSELRDSE
jgi:hypothetical protein